VRNNRSIHVCVGLCRDADCHENTDNWVKGGFIASFVGFLKHRLTSSRPIPSTGIQINTIKEASAASVSIKIYKQDLYKLSVLLPY
jgi:hypothetical protein